MGLSIGKSYFFPFRKKPQVGVSMVSLESSIAATRRVATRRVYNIPVGQKPDNIEAYMQNMVEQFKANLVLPLPILNCYYLKTFKIS